ncbi:MAG: lamin tail domain-containing protein [Planctomycetota bacterium]
MSPSHSPSRRRAARLVLAAAFPGGALLAGPANAQELEIHVLNVDQGAAAFVKGPDGTRVLIDAGSPGLGPTITNYLASIGVTDLDYTVLTSFDADHCGSMDEVANAGYAPNFAAWDRGDVAPKNTSQENQYKATFLTLRHLPTVGEQIQLGVGSYIECVAVNGQHATGTVPLSTNPIDENSRSLAVVIHHGDFEFYIGGDLTAGGNGTADVEGPVSANVGQIEAMQSSHHGSNTSSSATVIANFDPSFVVHSAGVNAGYGHPTKTTCNAFNTTAHSRVQWCTTRGNQQSGSGVFPTQAGGFVSANGNVKIRTDGAHFWVTKVSGGDEIQFACHGHAGITPTSGDVVISELLVNPGAAAQDYAEWFEIVNVAPGDVDLFGCKFRSGTQTFVLDTRIQLRPGEYAVVGLDGVTNRNGNVFCDICAPFEQFGLTNGTSYVEMLTPNDQVIDRVDWGGTGVQIDVGVSDEREMLTGPSTAANFSNAIAAWAGGDLGTPGEVNDADVPPVVGTVLSLAGPVHVGGQVQFELDSPNHPGFVYLLGLSGGIFPGTDYLGMHVPLNLDNVFFQFFGYPGFLANLDFAGHRTIVVPVANEPSLAGITVFSAFVVLEFDVPTFSWLPRAVSNAVVVTVLP